MNTQGPFSEIVETFFFSQKSKVASLSHSLSGFEWKWSMISEKMKAAFATHGSKTVYVPGLNLVLSYGDPPGFSDIEKILNTLAIVTALVLSMMFGLAGSVSYDTMLEADARYHENDHFRYYVDGFKSYDMVGRPPSAMFVKYASISNHMGLFTLFGVVVHYIYFVIGIDQGTDVEQIQIKIWSVLNEHKFGMRT